jgi:hypothetical protein
MNSEHESQNHLITMCAKYEAKRVPTMWRKGTTPDTIYPNECFYRSYQYISELSLRPEIIRLEGVYLVHGECILALGPHAWVELPGGLLFDGVRQRFYKQKAMRLAAWYKYTPDAANLLAANVCCIEPAIYAFYLPLKLPWGDPANPIVIDYNKALEYLVSSGIRPDLADSPLCCCPGPAGNPPP